MKAMKRYLSFIIPGLLALTILASCAPKSSDTIIYLVRHAEKITGENVGRDPALTELGHARTQELATLLKNKNIKFVHSSNYIRTRDTAAQLAKIVGVDIDLYNPGVLDDLVVNIKAQSGNHLVVGHSNTIPATVSALGGDGGTPIFEKSEYDRLYTVTLASDGTVHTDLQRYGVRYKAEE